MDETSDSRSSVYEYCELVGLLAPLATVQLGLDVGEQIVNTALSRSSGSSPEVLAAFTAVYFWAKLMSGFLFFFRPLALVPVSTKGDVWFATFLLLAAASICSVFILLLAFTGAGVWITGVPDYVVVRNAFVAICLLPFCDGVVQYCQGLLLRRRLSKWTAAASFADIIGQFLAASVVLSTSISTGDFLLVAATSPIYAGRVFNISTLALGLFRNPRFLLRPNEDVDTFEDGGRGQKKKGRRATGMNRNWGSGGHREGSWERAHEPSSSPDRKFACERPEEGGMEYLSPTWALNENGSKNKHQSRPPERHRFPGHNGLSPPKKNRVDAGASNSLGKDYLDISSRDESDASSDIVEKGEIGGNGNGDSELTRKDVRMPSLREMEASERLARVSSMRSTLTLAGIVRFGWPLVLIDVVQKASRPLVNSYIAHTQGHVAVAVLGLIYPIGHMTYGWLNAMKCMHPSYLDHPHMRFKRIPRFTAMAIVFSLCWGLTMTLFGLNRLLLEKVAHVSPSLARSSFGPLMIFAFFCIPVGLRASLSGWLTADKNTKALTCSGIVRLPSIVLTLVCLDTLGVKGATLGVAGLFAGFASQSMGVILGMWACGKSSLSQYEPVELQAISAEDEVIDSPGDIGNDDRTDAARTG